MNVKNLTTGLTYGFGGLTESTSFTYKEKMDNAPENANFTNGSSSSISYDSLGRKYRDYINSASGNVFTSTYSYVDHATVANRTSGLVSKIDYNLSTLDDIEYEYDSRGNITKITYGDLICDKYTYDSLNRLIQSDSELYDQTCVYTYDASGNIQTKTIYDCDNIYEALSAKDFVDTITYSYGSADWKDKLTAYDGNYIDYDEIGNPLSYNGKTFTWVGRRLNTYTSGSTTTSYTYNADGIRTSKTVGSTKTEYFLNGSQILAQKTGSNVIPFYYDANGTRIAFKYNGTMYYYVYNLQGDVTHIIDATGAIKGTYQYDAWGKILNINNLTAIAQANPFRYRGYYYDTESGLYYLNSRYYNAEWGRFINADGYVSTGQGITGYNMYEYCNNNPVMQADYTGALSVPATLKILKAASSFANCIINSSKSDAQKSMHEKKDKYIEKAKNAHKSTAITLLDDFCDFSNPVNNSLSNTSNILGNSIKFVSDKVGFASSFFCVADIIWDYNTYGLSVDFLTSACITISFTCLGIIAGAAIVATGWLPSTMLVASIGAGIIISDLEDKYRNYVLG